MGSNPTSSHSTPKEKNRLITTKKRQNQRVQPRKLDTDSSDDDSSSDQNEGDGILPDLNVETIETVDNCPSDADVGEEGDMEGDSDSSYSSQNISKKTP